MNDSENQKKSEKIVSIMNTGVMLLIVTAVVYLLFFAFNYGYNSYFGLPVYFSTMLPLRMISDAPTFFFVVALFCCIMIFTMPLRNGIKRVLFDNKTIIVFLILALIADFIWLRDIWSIIFLLGMLLYFLWFSSIVKKIKSGNKIEQQINVNEVEQKVNKLNEIEKEVNIRKSLHESGFIVLDDWLYKTVNQSSKMLNQSSKMLKCIKQEESKQQHYINKLGIDSIVLDIVSRVSQFILFISLLFAVTVVIGRHDAMNEDAFLFIDEQTMIIDIYERNYISIQVDYNKDENMYVQTGIYALIPIDNAELRLQKKEGVEINALK